MKSVKIVFLFVMAVLFAPTNPAKAEVFGGATTSVRREYHRETGDFRLSAELYAPGYDEPYWAWIGATQEWLKCPQVGRGKFSFILVTDDGKPVRYAKWSDDNRVPVEQWKDLTYGPNGFELDISLRNARRGNHTIFFAGSIKGGAKNYTKVWLLVDITIGGRRKDRRQVEALQFAVYSIDAPKKVDEIALANSQEQMGAGGTSLIGPIIEDEEDDSSTRRDPPTDNGGGAPASSGQSIRVCFKGFTSWVRIEWDNGQAEYAQIGENSILQVPSGVQTLNLFIIDAKGQATGGYRVKYNGKSEPYPASASEISVTRTAR